LKQIVDGLAAAHGAEVDIDFHRNYPVTFNHATETVCQRVADRQRHRRRANVTADIDPMMGGEDFSYMLNARPGAFIFIGNGDTAGLHNPAYDFNDEAISHGISYWVRLAEQRLGVKSLLNNINFGHLYQPRTGSRHIGTVRRIGMLIALTVSFISKTQP
jgi:metal-dependent amidase/aminoacylase/carboxypeptidase family protein